MRFKKQFHHKTAVRKPARKHKPIFYLVIFGIIFLAFAISYLLFLSPFLEIKNIEVSGAQKTDQIAVKDLAFSKMQRVAFVSGQNLFFSPDKNIKEELFARYPYLKSIEIQKKFPNT